MSEEQEQAYDVPSYDILDYRPRFPTITPKTKCDNKNEWGTWILDRESSTKDIVQLQKECVNATKNPNVDTESELAIETGNITNSENTDFETKDFTKPRSKQCELQLAKEFPKLQHYCRNNDNDMSRLNLQDMTSRFCTSGVYPMKCIKPSNFRPRKINVSCRPDSTDEDGNNVYKGMFLCTNGMVSCEPCAFDRLELERNLHTGFLRNFCNYNKHTGDCRRKGINSETGQAYNRGFLYNGFR